MQREFLAIPESIQCAAATFFQDDFSSVSINIDSEPLQHRAIACTIGEHLHFLPGALDLATAQGLSLLGHELTHVMQQRAGVSRCYAGAANQLVACPELEDEADKVGDMFARWCRGSGIPLARGGLSFSPERRALERDKTVIQAKVWAPEQVPGVDDELFWHATTFESVIALYNAEKIDVKRGDGWMGPGFYVTTAKSDYQKMMAFRNLQGNFKDETDRANYGHPMYLLCILAEGFWKMKAEILDGYGKPQGADTDFIGIRWSGDYGSEERTIKKPADGKSYSERTYARMGAYQDEPMFQLGVKPENSAAYKADSWHASKYAIDFAEGIPDDQAKQARGNVLDRLWRFAQQNDRSGGTGSQKLDLLVQTIGPRKAFKATLKELAFINTRLADKIHVVGAQAFAHKKMTLPEGADFESKSKLEKHYNGQAIDFENDKWVDLAWVESRILAQGKKA